MTSNTDIVVGANAERARSHNRQVVLGRIRAAERIGRAEIAAYEPSLNHPPAQALRLVPYLSPEEVRRLTAGCRGRHRERQQAGQALQHGDFDELIRLCESARPRGPEVRELEALARAERAAHPVADHRPNKRERRQIHRFKQNH